MLGLWCLPDLAVEVIETTSARPHEPSRAGGVWFHRCRSRAGDFRERPNIQNSQKKLLRGNEVGSGRSTSINWCCTMKCKWFPIRTCHNLPLVSNSIDRIQFWLLSTPLVVMWNHLAISTEPLTSMFIHFHVHMPKNWVTFLFKMNMLRKRKQCSRCGHKVVQLILM